jgi:FtsH-binding integral membrane protein
VFNNDPERTNQSAQPSRPGYPVSQTQAPYPSGAGTAVPNTLSSGVRVVADTRPREGFLTASFVWMFIGLLVSASAAWFVMSNPANLETVANSWFILLFAELGLVFAITLLIQRVNPLMALGMFFVYALLNGLTIGVIVWAYTAPTATSPGDVSGVVSAFLGASAIFAGAAIYGGVTRRDLTSFGGILFMGLIGLVVVSFLQIFFFAGSSTVSFLIGVVGVLVFTGLTAWDVQRIKNGQVAGLKAESASVMGALALYLDFVNLFLMLLRIFGSSR